MVHPSFYFGGNDPENRVPYYSPEARSIEREQLNGKKWGTSLQRVILLAEDNPGDAFLVEEALAEQDLPNILYHVKDGQEAIRFIERAEADDKAPCPGLLLLDLNLPKRNGRQVLERVRQSTKCGNIPVIVITSSQAASDREAMALLRADIYFRKPTNLEEFLEIGRVVKAVWDSRYKTEL